jgi:nucleoside-diphosphate-sugar epimerase
MSNGRSAVKTVLVTGGAGFIGGYVVEELLSRGYVVNVLDSRGRTVAGATTTLGDIRDAVAVGEAVSHSEGVIHLAGVLGTAEMIANPRPAVEVNIGGALNVFEAAGDLPVVNIATGNHWMDNTYSITKDTPDRFARMYNQFRGARITTVRAFDAYGPRQVPSAPFGPSRVRKIIPSFICRALSGQPIEVYGDGEQVIDLIYVADVARALVDALERTERDGPDTAITEAGSGVPISVVEVALKVLDLVGGRIVHLPMRSGESPGASIVAKVPLPDALPLYIGLPRTVAYYRDLLG